MWDDRGRVDEGGKASPKPVARKVTMSLLGNVAGNLASLVLLKGDQVRDQPAWLDGPGPWPAAEVLAARNALVHLPSFAAGSKAVRRPTPRFFSGHALDYDFAADAPPPAGWLAFLASLWPDDPSSVEALQEWFGYLLTPDTRQQKILMLIGPKRSGKGTIARILRALIGTENVANPTLSGLATNFGLAPLIGKLAAVVTDARLSGRTDVATVVERLLSISGEDGQTIDRKHLPPITTKLPTRFTVISNELPKLKDSSGALTSRMILLRLTRSFYGQEDPDLTAKLTAELPGILLWAIAGWTRLRKRDRFVQPESAREMIEELKDLSSPIGAFVREECEIGPGLDIECSRLFDRWKEWCKERGKDHVGDQPTFGRDLRSVLPNLETGQVRRGGSRPRVFKGLDLKAATF